MRFIYNIFVHFGFIELLSFLLILVNVFTFFLYALDKAKAKKGARRISEKVLIFFTIAFGGIGALLGMCFLRHKTRKGKFRVAVVVGLLIALMPVIHIVHAITLDRTVRYLEIEFRSENWPSELDGYRIAFMSDMHVIADETMREIATELNERNLDLLLLGGDFSRRNAHYRGTVREIAQIITTDGIFGVEGNHDDYERLFRAKEQYGVRPLDNCGIHIRERFFLAGVQDMWNREPDIGVAIEDAFKDDFVLLISHNPDVTKVQSTEGVDLILSGHAHGGQITIFGFPMYLLRGTITNYGTHFSHGFVYSSEGTPIFTSTGIGVYYYVPRIFARPEVVIFTMYSE